MTPRQFSALLDRWKQREDREYLRAGIIAAATHNYSGFAKKAISPMEFVPGYKKPKPTEQELFRKLCLAFGTNPADA